MKIIRDALILGTDFLIKYAVPSARRQAEEIIAAALKMQRVDLYLKHDQPLEPQELEQCRQALVRRSKGEPLSYILGQQPFADCTFFTDSSALIPRHESEELVEKIALDLANITSQKNSVLWDICCGSGCLGISLKKRLPELEVVLSDISPQAIDLAKKNAEKNRVDVSYRLGDLLEPFSNEKAHYIVCNPPYIAENEWALLEREVRDYEPYNALIAGPLGTEFYSRLAKELPNYLHRKAKVWFEIGESQGSKIKNIFSNPLWLNHSILCDLAGKERFFSVESQ